MTDYSKLYIFPQIISTSVSNATTGYSYRVFRSSDADLILFVSVHRGLSRPSANRTCYTRTVDEKLFQLSMVALNHSTFCPMVEDLDGRLDKWTMLW